MPSPLRLATLVASILLLTAAPASARTFSVDSLGDAPDAGAADDACRTAANECTLRAAIQQANATPNLPDTPDLIIFGVTQRITLGGQLPPITTDMDIRGPGAGRLTLWGNAAAQQRVLSIGQFAHVRITDLTIARGFADKGGGVAVGLGANVAITDCVIDHNSATSGGGIYSLGAVTLERTTVSENSAWFAASAGVTSASGGGLYAYGGTVKVIDSTFDGNAGVEAGAIRNLNASVEVTGSTFSRNQSLGNGGAIMNGTGSITLRNSTLIGNAAQSSGGAMYNEEGQLRVLNSTVAGNSARDGGGILNDGGTVLVSALVARNRAQSRADVASNDPVESGGGNLIGDATGVTLHHIGGPADLVGTAAVPIDPKLALHAADEVPPRVPGDPTETVALLPGSPAIDRGVDSEAPATDQRGLPRRRGAHVDVGAFESANQAPVQRVPDGLSTDEDTPLGVSISVSDPDFAGFAPATTTLSVPAGSGTLETGDPPAGVMIGGSGTETVKLTGRPAGLVEVRFIPARDANGALALTISTTDNGDGNPDSAATVTDTVPIAVHEVDDPPVAGDDTLDANPHLIPFQQLLRNDAPGPANEADQELTVAAVSDVSGGTAELTSEGVLFTAAPGYSGPARFVYTVRDRDASATATARFEVTAAAPDTAPVVLETRPAAGARGVSRTANVVAVFSEAIDPASGSVTLTRGGRSVAATVRYDAASHRIVLDPRGPLAAGVRYVATISGVKDLAGLPLAESVRWSFRTRSRRAR